VSFLPSQFDKCNNLPEFKITQLIVTFFLRLYTNLHVTQTEAPEFAGHDDKMSRADTQQHD
jgi:hypothetical protein